MINWFKIGFVVSILVSFLGMGLFIKHLETKVETLTTNLKTSEDNNKTLNDTIISQNTSILVANAKYEEVQKQITEANNLNKALTKEFKVIKTSLKDKPIPKTCEEATKEMVETGKKIGAKWQK